MFLSREYTLKLTRNSPMAQSILAMEASHDTFLNTWAVVGKPGFIILISSNAISLAIVISVEFA